MSKLFKVELWDINRIKPSARNTKIHAREQVERLAAVMKKGGVDQPIVVDLDGEIIKGHGRREAAIFLGWKQFPVIQRLDLTKAEADAARIADNAVSSTQYDTRALQEELKRLTSDIDLGITIDELGLAQKDRDLLLEELDQAVPESLMNDVSAEVEEHAKEEETQAEETDRQEISVAEALGFKRVTREQGRMLGQFLAVIEGMTGEKGAGALTAHAETVLGSAA